MTLQQRIDALTESMATIGYAPKPQMLSIGKRREGTMSIVFYETKFILKTASQLESIMAEHSAHAQFNGEYFFVTL